MARVKDEVIDVMERDGVEHNEAVQILKLKALANKEKKDRPEVGDMFAGFTYTRGDTDE
tara:strand:+ start:44 stop:220 length:177 start_codon:yes stop_codon:yes gene_type:complete